MVRDTTRRGALRGIAGAGLGLAVVNGTVAGDDSERYIVTGGNNGVDADVDGSGFEIRHEIANGEVLIVEGPTDARQELEAIPSVGSATADFELEPPSLQPADDAVAATDKTEFPDDWDWDRERIGMYEAHEYATGEGTRLGFIDSGVGAHPDLSNLNEALSRAYIDGEEHPYDGADRMHGSFCAGFAAGTGDWRIEGVAPETELVSLRRGTSSVNYIMALDYAASIGCDVVNMSFGHGPYEPRQNAQHDVGSWRRAFELAARDATRRGTTVVASQGNEGENLQQGGRFRMWGDLQGTIGASATDENDDLAEFSNYGTNAVTLGAPGVNGLGPVNYGDCEEVGVCDRDPPWFVASGTSLSAPYIAGAALLVRELRPDFNPAQVERALAQGADLVTGRGDPEFGAGRLNVLDTVEPLR